MAGHREPRVLFPPCTDGGAIQVQPRSLSHRAGPRLAARGLCCCVGEFKLP